MKTLISTALWIGVTALAVAGWTILNEDKTVWVKAAYSFNVLVIAVNIELISRSRKLSALLSRASFRRIYIACIAILTMIVLAPWGVYLAR